MRWRSTSPSQCAGWKSVASARSTSWTTTSLWATPSRTNFHPSWPSGGQSQLDQVRALAAGHQPPRPTELLMDALQLDLATIVARLEQVQEAGGFEHACPIVVDRILTCDLPRLREHLTEEAAALIED